MKKTKRLISVLLALLLVIGMIPLCAIQVAAETNISKIEVVNVKAPVAGETPHYWADTIGEGYALEESPLNEYNQNGIVWYCNDSPMTPTDTFEIGNSYTIRIELYRVSGYQFPDLNTIPVTINGDAAIISYSNTIYAEIEYTFSTVEEPKLDSIDIQVEYYEVGNSTHNLTFTSDDPIVTTGFYGENELYCIKIISGGQFQTLTETEFLAETDYYITYNIQVEGDYNTTELNTDDIRMNGQPAIGLVRPTSGVLQVTFKLPKLEKKAEEIYMVALRLPNVPKVGAKAMLPVIHAVNGNEELIDQVEMTECYWGISPYDSLNAFYQRIDSATPVTFLSGKSYQLHVELNLPENYVFSESYFAMLLCPEGQFIDIECVLDGSNHLTVNFYRNFNAPTKKPTLKKVELLLDGYQIGKNITDSKINAKINGDLVTYRPGVCGTAFAILNSNMGLIKTGTFKPNTQYYLVCIMSEHPNYAGNYKDLSKFTLLGLPAVKIESKGINNEYYFKLPILKKKVATITTQPKTTYAKEGATAKVTFKATGDGLKYQWYIKNKGATKYTKTTVTKSYYSVTMNSKSHGRSVYCIITDQYGNKVKSNAVAIRRQATITKNPATIVYAKKGAKASVKITALGDSLTYTWYVKNSGASKYSKSTVKSATYSVTMASGVKGRSVYCVVKDKYGKTATSPKILIRESVSIVTQPKTVTVKKNTTAKVSVKASGDGLKYQWYVKNSTAKKYSKSTVTKSTYSTTMNAKSKDRLVYCIITDKYGKSVKTNTVRLKMK